MLFLRKVAAKLPLNWQVELKRIHFKRKIKKNSFLTPEPEYKKLEEFISPGDWVIDVGANVGHYTKKFSDLVGAAGRVISFEPEPTTFSLLAANVQLFTHQNVTLVNAALSDKVGVVGIRTPQFETGLPNYYQTHISDSSDNNLKVMTLTLDALSLNSRIALVKIDAEGHESFVISGMKAVVENSLPVLIIENASKEVSEYLSSLNYSSQRLPNSPNVLFLPPKK